MAKGSSASFRSIRKRLRASKCSSQGRSSAAGSITSGALSVRPVSRRLMAPVPPRRRIPSAQRTRCMLKRPPAARVLPPDEAARDAGFRRVAGVDEAGRGPWAGPVVAAAVVLHRARLSVRIDDSKRLTPLQRARAFDVILRHADVGFGLACAAEIDRRNILQATLQAMRAAVLDLPEPD